MGLLIRSEELGYGTNVLNTHDGGMQTLSVFGLNCSLLIAKRDAGYHSRPHRHRSEQLNYVYEGEVWVFIEKEAFLARAGDFYRVPGNAVHWGWNLGEGPVSSFQAFAPPVDPYTRKNSRGLLSESELADPVAYHETEYLEDEMPYLEWEAQWLELYRAGKASTDL